MCGIAGLMGGAPVNLQVASRLTGMASALRHRGPDDAGHWYDPKAKIGLAHRRLSILELSAAGHQPMLSHCGRFALTFNGEIYNHDTLRDLLQRDGAAVSWRGRSDTETLLA